MGISVTGSGEVRRYSDDLWNCEAYSFGANQFYRRARHTFSLMGSFSRSCSYTQQATDTGLLAPNNLAETYSIAPAWRWQWTVRDSFSINPSYSQTDFIGSGPTSASPFSGNKSFGLTLSEIHQHSTRLTYNGSLFVSHSEFSLSGARSQLVYGFQVGANYRIDRRWSVVVGGGGRFVETLQSGGPSSGPASDGSPLFGELANLDLAYNQERAGATVSFSRSVNPSAFGFITQLTSFSGRANYQIARHLTINADISYQMTESVGQQQTSLSDRNYLSATVGLAWQFATDWRLTGSVVYRQQEFATIPGIPESHSVMVGLNYNWPGVHEAR